MNFRAATAADTGVMSRIQREALSERAEESYSPDQLRRMAAVESGREIVPAKRVRSEGTRYVIVESETGPVGYGGVDIDAEVLLATFVDPSVADQGIGSRIVQQLHERARDDGCESLQTYASLNAVAFYRKHGYSEIKQTTVGGEDGPGVPCVLMQGPSLSRSRVQ